MKRCGDNPSRRARGQAKSGKNLLKSILADPASVVRASCAGEHGHRQRPERGRALQEDRAGRVGLGGHGRGHVQVARPRVPGGAPALRVDLRQERCFRGFSIPHRCTSRYADEAVVSVWTRCHGCGRPLALRFCGQIRAENAAKNAERVAAEEDLQAQARRPQAVCRIWYQDRAPMPR